MIKAGDKVSFEKDNAIATATVRTGPYPKEFPAKYPDNTPTTFIEDAYDIELEDGQSIVEGIRRRYLKKVK